MSQWMRTMMLADANVLLAVLLPQHRHKQAAIEVLKGENVAISMLSVHLIFYFGLKDNFTAQKLQTFLAGFTIFDLTKADYAAALELVKGNDFENALQLAAALRSGCSKIATLDKGFAEKYQAEIEFITIPQ